MPRGGKLVIVQGRAKGGSWQTFASRRAGKSGAFKGRYRLKVRAPAAAPVPRPRLSRVRLELHRRDEQGRDPKGPVVPGSIPPGRARPRPPRAAGGSPRSAGRARDLRPGGDVRPRGRPRRNRVAAPGRNRPAPPGPTPGQPGHDLHDRHRRHPHARPRSHRRALARSAGPSTTPGPPGHGPRNPVAHFAAGKVNGWGGAGAFPEPASLGAGLPE